MDTTSSFLFTSGSISVGIGTPTRFINSTLHVCGSMNMDIGDSDTNMKVMYSTGSDNTYTYKI